MTSRLWEIWEQLRSSYWFAPAIMAFAAVIASLLAIEFDRHWFRDIFGDIDWLFNNQPEGARAVLSTLAGSMITVGGVVFSITLVTVANAAQQYGPRLLTNYMRDSVNQLTLGAFIATFLYCLMVLRAVQSAPPDAGADEATFFVPHFALLLALVMAVMSIGVLIHFLNHIPGSIHISNVIAQIGADLEDQVQTRFPIQLGKPADEDPAQALQRWKNIAPSELHSPDDNQPEARNIKAEKSGYVRFIDDNRLMSLLRENDLYLELDVQPGDFVIKGESLMRMAPNPDECDEICGALCDCVLIGNSRTPAQDMRFLANELVEIAARALSPGVNDPITAITCINWLVATQAELGRRSPPSPVRQDKNGAPRIRSDALTFEQMLESGLGQVIPYAATDKMATNALLDSLRRLANLTDGPYRAAVNAQIRILKASAGKVQEN
ncbi:MAG: hypothetical protein CME88_15060 [Hirschia sp.]|nr:hypothetical protein [Hirschia sp.]MBF19696.1 hypothetical protein [Hirschia sp.]